jgi:MHS family proline/betaine transporter-like MFS transporter
LRIHRGSLPTRFGGHPTPLAELCREHGATILLAMLVMMGQTVPVYAIVYYMPSYVTRVMHMPAITGFLSSAFSALLLVVIPPLSGLFTDRLPRRKPLVLVTSGCTALLVYPVFLMITRAHSALPILCGVGLISAVVALGAGVRTLLVLEALPARVRASGVAISHALHVALFGGTAQFIVTGLIKWTARDVLTERRNVFDDQPRERRRTVERTAVNGLRIRKDFLHQFAGHEKREHPACVALHANGLAHL